MPEAVAPSGLMTLDTARNLSRPPCFPLLVGHHRVPGGNEETALERGRGTVPAPRGY